MEQTELKLKEEYEQIVQSGSMSLGIKIEEVKQNLSFEMFKSQKLISGYTTKIIKSIMGSCNNDDEFESLLFSVIHTLLNPLPPCIRFKMISSLLTEGEKLKKSNENFIKIFTQIQEGKISINKDLKRE